MPLLGREPFVRQRLADNVSPEDEVFYCKTTNEAFITYDQFFERQILCSSMVWTCAISGRTGLTYDEALQSERTATEMLTSFPTGLQIPVLYLMNYINDSKFNSIVDMIYAFVTNRYFIAEEIETIVNTKRKFKGKVFRVIPPSNAEVATSEEQNQEMSSQTLCFGINPTLYKYEVIDNENNRHIVGAERITRTKGLLTKDKVKLFLKQHLLSAKRCQPMYVKESSIRKFKLNDIQWSHIFSGSEPNFEDQTVIVKTFNKDKQKAIMDSKRSSSHKNKSLNSSQKSMSSQKTNSKNKSKKMSPNSSCGKTSAKSSPNVRPIEDKQRIREKERQQKLEQKNREKEEKKVLEESMREWSAKRDDLACDDLRPLPQPIPLKCKIPVHLFADSVLVLEFFHSFNELFDTKSIFPSGVTFELMEQILCDDDIHGPYADLLKVLLTSNFKFQDIQEEEDINPENAAKDETSDEEERHNGEEERMDKFVETPGEKNANYYHNWIQNHLGLKLHQISLDPFHLTEVLRLYVLSSGAGPKPRSKNRGLYDSREDPAIDFVANNESILTKLEFESMFALSAEERLQIIGLLIHQLLAFVDFRDIIDESLYDLSQKRKQIRDIQMEFNKWSKDNALKKDSQTSNTSEASVRTAEQLKEYRREKSLKEEEKVRNCTEIRAQMRRLQACSGLKPIGFDRAFRKYWVFESIPGLFVEHIKPNTRYTVMPFGPCLEEPTPNKSCKPNGFEEICDKTDCSQSLLRDDSSTTSDKENDSNTTSVPNSDDKSGNCAKRSAHLSRLDRCTANMSSCCVHGLVSTCECPEWAFYYTSEQLEELILSLNCRGFREYELMAALNREKSIIIDSLDKCQPNKFNDDIPVPETRRSHRLTREVFHTRKAKSSSSSSKSALREDLLCLEERIYAGSLAVGSKASREEWKGLVQRDGKNRQELIENLSKAIIILTKNIRPMCLSVPLSEDNSVLPNWELSLQESTSMSQLFVHLSVLDYSITWSKSALKAYCKLCRRKCDAEYMLLCDVCNRGHHIYCLRPSLDAIPRGEWLCPDCSPKTKPQTPKKDKSLSKSSYESQSEYETSDEEFDGSDSDSSDKLSSIRSNSPRDDPEVCALCNKTDTNLELSCAKCRDYYHLSCANVKRITRSDWFCSKCLANGLDRKRKKANVIDINISDDSQSSEVESKRPKRSRYSQDFDFMNGRVIEEEEEERVQRSATGSRRRLAKGSELPLDFGLCEDILKKLQRHNEGWLFRSRPNHAPNYNKIIKSYVDFGQLVSKLNMNYTSNSQFFRDVLIMLNNALFYNPKDSPEYESSLSLAQYFEQLLEENGLDLKHKQ